jgi:hypothetical protein
LARNTYQEKRVGPQTLPTLFSCPLSEDGLDLFHDQNTKHDDMLVARFLASGFLTKFEGPLHLRGLFFYVQTVHLRSGHEGTRHGQHDEIDKWRRAPRL